MPEYLANTALTSLSIGPKIFAYAQGYHGELIEAQGRLTTPEDEQEHENVYYANGQMSIGLTTRWRNGKIQRRAPKMFTPLAAASLGEARYLIYVNDDNILHDVVYENGEWREGKLCDYEQVKGVRGVRCAPYSKLAAATVTLEEKTIICVYYQTTEKNGPVSVVSFIPGNSWNGLAEILRLLLQLRDPPLYGTSLAAVKPRHGITVAKANKNDDPEARKAAQTAMQLPVVYLQWDTNALAHGQGKTIRPVPGLEEFGMSPHTSLSVVDDGNDLYCFYITNDNAIQMVRIDEGSAQRVIDHIASPTPRSSIAAVMPLQHRDRIVLFYQIWDKGDSEKVEIKAQTFSKSGAGPDDWSATVITDAMG